MRIDRLRHGVVVRAGPGCDLEPLASWIARIAGRRTREGRAGIDGEPLRSSGEVTRLIVDACLLGRVVERRSAQRLLGHELAEPCAGLVHQERLKVREAEVTLDIADPFFAPHCERYAVGRAPAALRRDVDDAVPGARPVQRGARGPLDHLDRLDVLRVDVRERAVDDDAVHDVEGILPAPGGIDRGRPAQQYCRLRARPTAVGYDVGGNLALQLAQRVLGRHRHPRSVDPRDAERHLDLLGRFLHPGYHDLLKQVRVGREREILSVLSRAQDQLSHRRLVADHADLQCHCLPGDAHRRNQNRVRPGAVRVHTDVQLRNLYRGRGEGVAAVVYHATAHHRLLSPGFPSRAHE